MGEAKKIVTKDLKSAVAEINELGMEGVDTIRTVGIKTANMAMLFIEAVATIGKLDEDKLSDSVVEMYNSLPSKKELADMGAVKTEKGKKKKKDTVKKEPVAKSRYGHQQSAKSGKLDDALFEGGTMEDIMKDLDIPRARFTGHSNHLKNDLGLTLVITADKDKNKLKDHYKIKEESLEKK